MINYDLAVIRKALFLATCRDWTLVLRDEVVTSEEIVLIYDDGKVVRTTPEIYQTIPRNFSIDWIEITYPTGVVKPYRFPAEPRSK